MSSGSSQANKFYEEVSESQRLWFAETDDGDVLEFDVDGDVLEFDVDGDKVSFPLWSSKSRIIRLKKLNPELLGEYSPRVISWQFFKDVLSPMLIENNRLIGVNFSGQNITGIDLTVESLIKQIEAFA
ncbi:DUF2750 domain-containing protein [Shewanella sp. MBTL60-007]|uniref:DUF2750 domain-containing protein n=1 Tax=Shewanella sp. MBTL60-007 TaxID=2815911 RepID=UPI001BC77E3D|nr:DUF2750 domain-containing protein [Shewanella sp. MBTL60-007]GIU18464.1 hypothetical protein TUM3792_14600 [Shewanella sp. MBTL60-007]